MTQDAAAGVVDQHVDSPESLLRLSRHLLSNARLTEVTNEGERAHVVALADIVGCGARVVGNVADHDRRAFGSQPACDAEADAAGSAGNDRHLVSESRHGRSPRAPDYKMMLTLPAGRSASKSSIALRRLIFSPPSTRRRWCS